MKVPRQLLWLLVACGSGKDGGAGTIDDGDADVDADADGDTDPFGDADGDGFAASEDCDDTDPARYPGAVERCDGEDDDCDGLAETGGAVTVQGGGTFATVQEAVSAAPAGGTVVICPGTWAGNVAIQRDITLRGRDGAFNTTLTGFGAVAVIDGTLVSSLVLADLTIADAASSAVFMPPGSTLTATDIVVERNTATDGAGLVVANALLTGVEVRDNEASDRGGGLFLTGGTVTCAGGTRVSANYADYGGGIWVDSDATLVDCVVTQNSAQEDGAGVYVGPGAALDGPGTRVEANQLYGDGGGVYVAGTGLSNVAIVGNDASDGGGGLLLNSEGALVTDVLIDANFAGAGGGILAREGATLERVTVTDNTTDSGDGGGILLLDPNNLTLIDCDVADNRSQQYGGGLYLADSTIVMDGGSLQGNTATWSAGGAYVAWSASITFMGTVVEGNSPTDLADTFGLAYDLGGTVDTTCVAGGCSP